MYGRRMRFSLTWLFTSVFMCAAYYGIFHYNAILMYFPIDTVGRTFICDDFVFFSVTNFEQELKCQTLIVTHLIYYVFFGYGESFRGSKQTSQ